MSEMKFTPWRMTQDEDGLWEVWTKYDSTPGSKNNYVVAGDIQTFEEAKLLCNAPEAVETLRRACAILHPNVKWTKAEKEREWPIWEKQAQAILARIGGDGK